jgi:hypothetical protein
VVPKQAGETVVAVVKEKKVTKLPLCPAAAISAVPLAPVVRPSRCTSIPVQNEYFTTYYAKFDRIYLHLPQPQQQHTELAVQ